MTETKNLYQKPVHPKHVTKEIYNDSPVSVDFIVPVKTQVVAAFTGKVLMLKRDGQRGGEGQEFSEFENFVELSHENGEHSRYGNLDYWGVVPKVNVVVRKGQTIGYSGATGDLKGRGAHLNFMIRVPLKGNDPGAYRALEIRWQ